VNVDNTGLKDILALTVGEQEAN